MDGTELLTFITAAGALGGAAFGLVDILKAHFDSVGAAGFKQLKSTLGKLSETLEAAFGSQWEDMMRALYRGPREEMGRVLRQGVRVGLTPGNAASVAGYLGALDAAALREAAHYIRQPVQEEKETTEKDMRALRILSRYEMAADARIDAALELAQEKYKGAARLYAMLTALLLGGLAGLLVGMGWISGDFIISESEVTAVQQDSSTGVVVATVEAGEHPETPQVPPVEEKPKPDMLSSILKGLVLGLIAVPLAPIAKDVATAIQGAAIAIRSRT